MEFYLLYKVFIPWQLTVILMKYMVEKLYHITYKQCQQTVIFITINMRIMFIGKTVIFTLVIYTNGNDMLWEYPSLLQWKLETSQIHILK